MFSNGTELLAKSEIKLKYVAVEYIPSHTVDQIFKIFNKVMQLYVWGYFITHKVLMDTEFEKLVETLGKV